MWEVSEHCPVIKGDQLQPRVDAKACQLMAIEVSSENDVVRGIESIGILSLDGVYVGVEGA